MSYRWKEQTVPMVSLHCLNTAIRKVGSWAHEPQELRAHNSGMAKLKAAQTSEQRALAIREIVAALRNQIDSGTLPHSLSIEIDGRPLKMTLQAGRYVISGEDNRLMREVARTALKRLSDAYGEAVASLRGEISKAEAQLDDARADAASVQEFNLERERLQAEKLALENAQDSLKKSRAEEITVKAKALGYSIREVKVGNAVQLNLVRRV